MNPIPSKSLCRDSLHGHYGFLADYSQKTKEQAHQIVQDLYNLGIREFQFYDWFAGYSKPLGKDSWVAPFKCSKDDVRWVFRKTLDDYIEKIHELKDARAWAYVQAVGADEPDLDTPDSHIARLQGKDKEGKIRSLIHPEVPKEGSTKFFLYFPNAAWARRMAGIWGEAVSSLKFHGIHWDTLGTKHFDPLSEVCGIHEFLETAHTILSTLGLKQTMNFVSVAWWDTDIVNNYLTFPYVEVWSKAEKDYYYKRLEELPRPITETSPFFAVLAYYPSCIALEGKEWESLHEEERVQRRLNEALQKNVSYLILGTTTKQDMQSEKLKLGRLINEYFPNADPLSDDLKKIFREKMIKYPNLAICSKVTFYLYCNPPALAPFYIAGINGKWSAKKIWKLQKLTDATYVLTTSLFSGKHQFRFRTSEGKWLPEGNPEGNNIILNIEDSIPKAIICYSGQSGNFSVAHNGDGWIFHSLTPYGKNDFHFTVLAQSFSKFKFCKVVSETLEWISQDSSDKAKLDMPLKI